MSLSEISVPNSKMVLSFVAQGVNLPLTSIILNEFSGDSDVIGADTQELGTMTIGANGDGVFSSNGELGAIFTIKLLQGSIQSKTIDEIIVLQRSGTASVTVSGLLSQTDSGQEEIFSNGKFIEWMPVPARGKGSQESPTYKIHFVNHEKVAA